MGVVITVMNMKGGVGKTTVAMHLAGMLCRYTFGSKARKVLAIDYDPQFNLSQAFIPPAEYFAAEKAGKTTLSILSDDDAELDPFELQVPGNYNPPAVDDVKFPLYLNKGSGGLLDIIPSTLDLMYVALGHPNANIKPMEERFRKFIESARSIYDVIIIDCHPAGSVFTQTSLRNSDHVVIPVAPQRYAVRGVGLMMDFIAAKHVGNSGPKPHILFNSMPRSGVSKEETDIRSQKKFEGACMANTLKKYKAFSDPEAGKGFIWASGKPYSDQAFFNLSSVVGEIVTRTGV